MIFWGGQPINEMAIVGIKSQLNVLLAIELPLRKISQYPVYQLTPGWVKIIFRGGHFPQTENQQNINGFFTPCTKIDHTIFGLIALSLPSSSFNIHDRVVQSFMV